MPISYRDIEENDSSVLGTVIALLNNKIERELERVRFVGPGTFTVELAEFLTVGAVNEIKRQWEAVRPAWKSVKIYQRAEPSPMWCIDIEGWDPLEKR